MLIPGIARDKNNDPKKEKKSRLSEDATRRDKVAKKSIVSKFKSKKKDSRRLTLETGLSSEQGRRKTMEDAHVIIDDLTV